MGEKIKIAINGEYIQDGIFLLYVLYTQNAGKGLAGVMKCTKLLQARYYCTFCDFVDHVIFNDCNMRLSGPCRIDMLRRSIFPFNGMKIPGDAEVITL